MESRELNLKIPLDDEIDRILEKKEREKGLGSIDKGRQR